MSGSRLARRLTRHHGRYRGRNDLNIVPMLDVMTILVFFLIFTAVFSRTNVLQLDLPAPGVATAPLPPGLELEIIVRHDAIEVADRGSGVLKRFPSRTAGHDLEGLGAYLRTVKASLPQKTNATVLLEPEIPYDVLVQVMDTVRSFEQVKEGRRLRGELFPDVAIGDAPT